jgi:hypothetical protein
MFNMFEELFAPGRKVVVRRSKPDDDTEEPPRSAPE